MFLICFVKMDEDWRVLMSLNAVPLLTNLDQASPRDSGRDWRRAEQ